MKQEHPWFVLRFDIGDQRFDIESDCAFHSENAIVPPETLLAMDNLVLALSTLNCKLGVEKVKYGGTKTLIPDERIRELVNDLDKDFQRCEEVMNSHGYKKKGEQQFVINWRRLIGDEGEKKTSFWMHGGCIFEVPGSEE